MKYGWHATFMPKPLFGENGSGMHTHLSLFKDGRTPSSTRTTSTTSRDTAKAFIAGQLEHAREICADLRPVGQLLQAARAGLRGAGLRRLVAAQPLGADPGAALPAGQGAGDAGRAALPRPGLQPVPHASRRCCTRASRGSRRATSCPSRWSRTSTTCRPRSAAGAGIEQLPETLGEAIELAAESRAGAAGARRAHLPPLHRDQARRSGRTTACRSRSGSSTATCRCSDQPRRKVLKTVVLPVSRGVAFGS